ncbi:DUF429 domain-containing protein [Streptacidiphilus cavernicola]|uniref:DUF429 domain-containing protein n=1 Tax=Streptacidiphilus cavernicola TaxID=3342716 RepID=A0ABV6VW36_9ACTN
MANASDGPVTLGVDLASSSERTSACRVVWAADGLDVAFLDSTEDGELVAAILAADKTGLDCPLGWPRDFVALLAAHDRGLPLPPRGRYDPHPDGRPGLDRLCFRLTDDLTWKAAKARPPLSVSTNLLGVVALRAAHVLAALQERGCPVPRDGSGRLAEVYPAAALRGWGIVADGSYKNARPEAGAVRAGILDALEQGLGRSFGGEVRERCRRSHDDLDALICALVARAALVGATGYPGSAAEEACAETEGWIHLPRGPLADLLEQ